ncbi:thioredoxin-related transmembrane protein 2-like [Oscarella lobularis]|uniref:thioredoxin-related transmembrane protein 2-like n=1 Tax=Oscarella lobularis TaxID=121494 RepID=UPI0033143B8F
MDWDFLKPHYVLNTFASAAYLIVRLVPFVCNKLFDDKRCELITTEAEIYILLSVIVAIKARRFLGDWRSCASVFFMFAKVANLVLFFQTSKKLMIWYAIALVVLFLAFPEPPYSGEGNVKQLTGPSLKEELNNNPDVAWVVLFYAPWASPSVRAVAPFTKLSKTYASERIMFGKMDISRYPPAADRYKIDMSYRTKQIPTIVVFENGQETGRQPKFVNKRIEPFDFTQENVLWSFDLKTLAQKYSKPKQGKDKKE